MLVRLNRAVFKEEVVKDGDRRILRRLRTGCPFWLQIISYLESVSSSFIC